MVEIEWQDDNLRRVLAEGSRMAEKVMRACEHRLQRHWALKIAADADEMVPEQFSILKNSQQIERIPGGFRITYGGLSTPYAKDQHENTSYHHNPPRYKYSYEGKGPGPGALNPPRGSGITAATVSSVKSHRARSIWTAGGSQVRTGAGGGWWRYETVHYSRRSLRTDHPIKAAATHHWLYGQPFSAYERNADRLKRDIQQWAAAKLGELLDAA